MLVSHNINNYNINIYTCIEAVTSGTFSMGASEVVLGTPMPSDPLLLLLLRELIDVLSTPPAREQKMSFPSGAPFKMRRGVTMKPPITKLD